MGNSCESTISQLTQFPLPLTMKLLKFFLSDSIGFSMAILTLGFLPYTLEPYSHTP